MSEKLISVSELFRASWKEFGRMRGILMMLSVAGMLPGFMGGFLASLVLSKGVSAFNLGPLQIVVVGISVLGFATLGFIWGLWMNAGIYVAVRDRSGFKIPSYAKASEGKQNAKVYGLADLRIVLEGAKPYIFRLWWVGVLVWLCVIGAAIPFLIPIVIVVALLSFSMYEVIYGQTRGVEALARSRELFRGRFWPVFLRAVLAVLVVFAISATGQIGFLLTKSSLVQTVAGMAQWLVGLWSVVYTALLYEELVRVYPPHNELQLFASSGYIPNKSSVDANRNMLDIRVREESRTQDSGPGWLRWLVIWGAAVVVVGIIGVASAGPEAWQRVIENINPKGNQIIKDINREGFI